MCSLFLVLRFLSTTAVRSIKKESHQRLLLWEVSVVQQSPLALLFHFSYACAHRLASYRAAGGMQWVRIRPGSCVIAHALHKGALPVDSVHTMDGTHAISHGFLSDRKAMNHSLTRRSSESIALVALFAALIAVMGLIPKIDLPLGVHISIQTLGVMLAGCLLGPWRGLQAILIFLVAVAAGLPLLAGGRGGLGVFMAPTTGYLVGWTAAAFVTGSIMAVLPKATPLRAAVSACIASAIGSIAVLYVFGIAGLIWIAKIPLMQAIWANVAFIPGDLIKCVLTALVVHSVARAMPDWRLGGVAPSPNI